MIYLLYDCYKDKAGIYQEALKIGFSAKSFLKSRKTAYDTHNYGYRLIEEREGSLELEGYLHWILRDYNLSFEWFRYDPEVIKIFRETKESDIKDIDKESIEFNQRVKSMILENLVVSESILSEYYLNGILMEFGKEVESDVRDIFNKVSEEEINYFREVNIQVPYREWKNLSPKLLKGEVVKLYQKLGGFSYIKDNIVDDRVGKSKEILGIYNTLPRDTKNSFLKTFKDYIECSSYLKVSDDDLVYDKNLEEACKRAYEVYIEETKGKNILSQVATEFIGSPLVSVSSVPDLIRNDYIYQTTKDGSDKEEIRRRFLEAYKGDSLIINMLF